MPDAATETEADQPLPLPECAQATLTAMLAHRGIAYCAEDGRVMTGTEDEPGQVLPCTARDGMIMLAAGLIGGERGRLLTTRKGRHYARVGSMDGYDPSTTDLDLAAWSTGRIDYLEQELLAALEAYYYRVALTRAEVLEIIINLGVVSPAEARTDV